MKNVISVGVSNRHVHLCREDLEVLFGKDYQLKPIKNLSQPGEFAAEETVIIAGPKGVIENVRVLGPLRKRTQVEISRTDAYKLGLNVPVRDSGNLDGTPGCTIIGPKGTVVLKEGVILAKIHIHMTPKDAEMFNVNDKDKVAVLKEGERPIIYPDVLVRVSEKYALEMHVDTDEANAANIRNGDNVIILGKSDEVIKALFNK